MHYHKRKLALAMSHILLLASFEAFAQQVAPDTPPDTEDAVTLERVVATAQKRVEYILEVPAAINVIEGSWLESTGAGQLTDFAAYIPGFQVDSGGSPGKVSMALRGLAPLGTSATIGSYIDDTPLGSSGQTMAATTYALDLLPYDIESVEVLSGPQGTLYGASSMGGLVKYITRDADVNDVEMRAGVDASNVSNASKLGWGGRASFNMPLAPGKVGLRASVSRKYTPGYIDNSALGTKGQNGYDQLASRLALTWKIHDDASLRFQGIWQRVDADNTTKVALDALNHKPLTGTYTSINALAEPYKNDLDYYAATLDWNLGWATFVSASSFSKSTLSETQDLSATYGPLFPLFGIDQGLSDIRLDFDLEKWTQELRLASVSSDHVEWLAGAFFTGERANQRQNLIAYDNDGNGIAPLNPMADVALPSKYKESAVFADVTYKVSPRFDLSLGARLARNTQQFTQITSGALVGEASTPGRSSETVSTYKFSSRWHVSDDAMFYGRVASGYRPGGPNVSLPGVPISVKSDSTVNYEVGFKADLLDRRASLEIAAFSVHWKDMQVVAFTDTNLSYLDNAGGGKSKGVELSTLFRPMAGMRVGLNGAWTDAHLDNDVPPASGLVAGGRMPMTPKLSWSAIADYSFTLQNGWTASMGGAYRHVGNRVGLQGFAIDGYNALDLHADVGNHTWSARLFIRNAANSKGYMSIAPMVNGATGATSYLNGVPVQPRTIGIALDYRY